MMMMSVGDEKCEHISQRSESPPLLYRGIGNKFHDALPTRFPRAKKGEGKGRIFNKP